MLEFIESWSNREYLPSFISSPFSNLYLRRLVLLHILIAQQPIPNIHHRLHSRVRNHTLDDKIML